MEVSVSKARALVEMVRAYDAHDENKGKKIGTIISENVQKDSKKEVYSENIELSRKSKQLFPQKIRKYASSKSLGNHAKKNKIKICTDQGNYLIEIADGVKLIQQIPYGEEKN